MGFQTIGRVLAKWHAVPLPPDLSWGLPLAPEEARRFYLEVAVVHPQTEQARRQTVTCVDETQWERYPIGGWLRLRVRQLVPFLGAWWLVSIEE